MCWDVATTWACVAARDVHTISKYRSSAAAATLRCQARVRGRTLVSAGTSAAYRGERGADTERPSRRLNLPLRDKVRSALSDGLSRLRAECRQVGGAGLGWYVGDFAAGHKNCKSFRCKHTCKSFRCKHTVALGRGTSPPHGESVPGCEFAGVTRVPTRVGLTPIAHRSKGWVVADTVERVGAARGIHFRLSSSCVTKPLLRAAKVWLQRQFRI